MIDAIILCGGNGTRMYPQTATLPKPLVTVGRRAVLDLVIDQLVRHGVRRIILCAGFRAEDIMDHVRTKASQEPVASGRGFLRVETRSPSGDLIDLLVSDTGVGTPTGARVHLVESLLHSPETLVLYGDGLADVPVQDLLEYHRKIGAPATVTTARVPSPFGHVRSTGDGLVHSFEEKPILPDPVNIGYIVLDRSARGRLTPASGQLEQELLPELASDGLLAAFAHQGHFERMDTLADRKRLESMWRDGELSWLEEQYATSDV